MAQGVANRDIKLENTLLDDSERPLLKICDFGYSKVCHKAWNIPGSNITCALPSPLVGRDYLRLRACCELLTISHTALPHTCFHTWPSHSNTLVDAI